MYLKIIATNGRKKYLLCWVKHTGKDIYIGYPSTDLGFAGFKYSYHESGQFHIKEESKITHIRQENPLNEFKGIMQITGVSFFNTELNFKTEGFYKEDSNKKANSYTYIDSRSYPSDIQINTTVGLVEPFGYEILKERLDPFFSITNVIQLNLITFHNPWIWVLQHYSN